MKKSDSMILQLSMIISVVIFGCQKDKESHSGREESDSVDLDQVFLENIKKEQGSHRTRLAAYIRHHADRVVIYTLQNVIVEQDPDDPLGLSETPSKVTSFQIAPYEHSVKIISQITIKEDVKNISAILADIIRSSGHGSVWKHTPTYGVAVYRGEQYIWSTSISVETDNFYIVYPSTDRISYDWLSVGDSELKKFVDYVENLKNE
ncbi:hypothetical protein [Oceaniferula spumae]